MYIGPDVLLPVASAVAAVAGALLLLGRRTIDVVRKVFRGIARVFGGR
jgi:hypothetical protein